MLQTNNNQQDSKIYFLVNHDSLAPGVKPKFDPYTLEEYNEEFDTKYQTIEQAVNAEPEWLYTKQDVDNWTEDGEGESIHKLYSFTVWQGHSGIYSRYFASEDEARDHVNSDYSEELPENKYPGDRNHTEITEFVFAGPKPKTEAEIEDAWASDHSEITRSIYFVKSEN